MAKNRNDRYESAVDLARALTKAAFGEERTLPTSTTMIKRQDTSPRSSRRRGGVAVFVVLLLAAAGAFALRDQLAFLGNPRPSATVSVTVTSSPAPTLTDVPTATATLIQETSTVVPPLGNIDKIALLSGNDLYLMNSDGTELTLVRTDNTPKSGLHWINDGRLIYMARNCAYMLDSKTNQTQEIVCFDADEVLEGFRVSSDGKLAAISIQRTLNILPFDLNALKDVTTRFSLDDFTGSCFYNQYPFREVIWSKDDTQLAARVIDTKLVDSDQIFLLNVNISNCATEGPVRMDRIPGSHINFEKDSSNRVASYDWDGSHLFLLNNSIRNDGFGNLYLYDSATKESVKLNPIKGECCYRDARWSADGKYIFFAFQKSDSSLIDLYYISLEDVQNGKSFTPIELPGEFFPTPRDKPQPALRPVQ
jgi:Tol biopolymer transport system component